MLLTSLGSVKKFVVFLVLQRLVFTVLWGVFPSLGDGVFVAFPSTQVLLIGMEGLRRYHERILSESERRYNGAIREWEKCVINTRDFSAVVSAATELYQHLNGGSGESDDHMLKRWFADAERALENRLGRDAV